jgi:hypothetical protein
MCRSDVTYGWFYDYEVFYESMNLLMLSMISYRLLCLLAAVCAGCFNAPVFATSSWSQNMSLPLSEKPTDMVHVYYSM